VTIYPLRIPFQRAFAHAQSEREASDAVVVGVAGEDGSSGYGEALPRPYVTGEDVPGMLEALRSVMAPLVLNGRFKEGTDILDDLAELNRAWSHSRPSSPGTTWNATFCAIELALLDWAFRRAGMWMSDWLVPVRNHVIYTGVIEAADPRAAGAIAQQYAAAGFKRLKVKVGTGNDLERLRAVRDVMGQQAVLRIDANGAWSADDAIAALKPLAAFGIEAVEQPVAAGDLEGMARVRRAIGLRVVADESLLTEDNAKRLIAAGACDSFNVRVSKCGGLLASRAIARLALANGLGVTVGAQVGETSLLSAAGRHLAASLPLLESAEGSFGTHLLTEDITPETVMFGYEGRGDVLIGPGLGVTVDQEALERRAIETIRITR
jgi:muconate cycloisomerase